MTILEEAQQRLVLVHDITARLAERALERLALDGTRDPASEPLEDPLASLGPQLLSLRGVESPGVGERLDPVELRDELERVGDPGVSVA